MPGKAPEAADECEVAPDAEFCVGICADRCDGWREEGYREACMIAVSTRVTRLRQRIGDDMLHIPAMV